MRKCSDHFLLNDVSDYLLASGYPNFREFRDACARWQAMYEILAWAVDEFEMTGPEKATFPFEQMMTEFRKALFKIDPYLTNPSALIPT